MNNDLETIAKRYWEIYNSFDGQTHLIDLEIETINGLQVALVATLTDVLIRTTNFK